MAEIPASTPSPDATVAQTPRATSHQVPARNASVPIPFMYRFNTNAPARPKRKKEEPLYRPLHIYALDPSQPKLDGKVAVVNVPWEKLAAGPTGRLFEVETTDPTQIVDPNLVVDIKALDLDDPFLLMGQGMRPTTSDGRFHRQMVYAVCSSVYNAFFKALGRDLSWGFANRSRLLLRPFAFEGENAFYDPDRGELQFGYFVVPYSDSASDTIYTSLSHDIIAHELTHALLHGLRGKFIIPSNPDVLAFHEGFADLIAIFHHFSYPEIVRAAIRDSDGKLDRETILSGIARQFGEGVGIGKPLRTAIDFKSGVPETKYGDVSEPHALGAVLVAAVFDAFTRVFRRKTTRVIRLATGGSSEIAANLPHDLLMAMADEASKLAAQFLVMCVRAVDYCPPVDITFGEFLRAVITADRDLVPDDPWAYREAWLDAFRLRQIFPDDVRHMSEDAIEWRAPLRGVTIPALHFARLQFAGDPAHIVAKDELDRQANALGEVICQRDLLADFGLLDPRDETTGGDTVDAPCIESIRSLRRIGPDGQITFDLVAEVTQRREFNADGKTVEVWGGSTIIIGPDGDVRYVIGKNLRNEKRLAAQAAFATAGNRFWVETGGAYRPAPNPFRLVHRPQRP